jgi:hypothetical protein
MQHLVVSHMYDAQRRSRLRSNEVVEVDLLDPDPGNAPAYRVELSPLYAVLQKTAQSQKLEGNIFLFNCIFNLPLWVSLYRRQGNKREEEGVWLA